jgi:beta-glucosidase
VDTLLANDIEPWATLYHWDLPQTLEETGGWANRDTAYHFGEYAETVLRRLGDRVPNWITLNEPWCAAFLGYASGLHAPGRTEPSAAVAAAHHLLLGHGLAMHAIRSFAPEAKAGITLNLIPVHAADPADDAIRRIDGLQNRMFLDPVVYGTYPEDVLADLAPYGLTETIKPGDLELIHHPMDMLGINYYSDAYVATGTEPQLPSPWVGCEHVQFPDRDLPRTDMGWDITPDGLTDLLLRLHQDYPGMPLYITENGAAFTGIEDVDRVRYLDSHLRSALAAIRQGVDLRGYFLWSLVDNFEWSEGYSKRFGIVHVDYDTQVRTPKTSAHWYSRVIAANALP